jgi:hypothetical protein
MQHSPEMVALSLEKVSVTVILDTPPHIENAYLREAEERGLPL